MWLCLCVCRYMLFLVTVYTRKKSGNTFWHDNDLSIACVVVRVEGGNEPSV